MKTPDASRTKAFARIGLGLAFVAAGIFVAGADDKPGSAILGMLLMLTGVIIGVGVTRNRLPKWAARTAFAVGAVVAAFAAFQIHALALTAPLFPTSQQVPSAVEPVPSAQYQAAVTRARAVVRARVLEQNLPGVSVAVGAGGTLVWAEGFGWRDVSTRTPVTPHTRFNIGSAAPAIVDSVGSLRLPNSGTDSANEWSPEGIGEPGEDFPPLAAIRHVVLTPLGLAPAEYPLRGDRATFYVPSTFWRSDTADPRQGRRLMYMRDLACCAKGKPFFSTPSDLVRFALATHAASINGELAGGTVMSLMTKRDNGIVVAVTSNISHANTSSLAARVADAFAEQTR